MSFPPKRFRRKINKHKHFSLFFIITIFLLLGISSIYFFKKYNANPQISKNSNIATNIQSTAIGETYYISPSGDDTNSGKNSITPLKTIQEGINIARPGDIIYLSSGVYYQDVITKTNGTAQAPITIIGPKDAIIKGGGNARIFEINHDHIILQGFTIDGLFGDPQKADGYRDKLLYIQGKKVRSGVTGLKVINVHLKNAGGECLRLRYFAHDNEITKNTIGPCGVADFKFPSDSKNGEGIYIGTSSNQWNDGKNPTNDPDESTRNWIHHNTFNTQGNECVDAKEGSFGNIIEYNTCTGQKDPESGGFDSRGDKNIFRHNEIYGNLGAGVRLGGHTVNDVQYGKNNDVYNNTIRNNKNGALNIQVIPQGKICGNKVTNNGDKIIIGETDSSINPQESCR